MHRKLGHAAQDLGLGEFDNLSEAKCRGTRKDVCFEGSIAQVIRRADVTPMSSSS